MTWYYYNASRAEWEEQKDLPQFNRAFLYGDGFFDTMLLIDGVPAFWDYHLRRIESTMKYLQLENAFDLNVAINQLYKNLLEAQQGNGRLRLSFYRSGAGKYTPESNSCEMVAIVEPYEDEIFPSHYPSEIAVSRLRIPSGEFGNHKTIGKHLQIKVALEANKSSFNDLILLNEKDEVAETVSSNLFLVLDGKLHTPPLSSGALAGAVRQVIIDSFDVECSESLTLNDVKNASELFTSNSIAGIKPYYIEKGVESKASEDVLNKLRDLQLNSVQGFLESLP